MVQTGINKAQLLIKRRNVFAQNVKSPKSKKYYKVMRMIYCRKAVRAATNTVTRADARLMLLAPLQLKHIHINMRLHF